MTRFFVNENVLELTISNLKSAWVPSDLHHLPQHFGVVQHLPDLGVPVHHLLHLGVGLQHLADHVGVAHEALGDGVVQHLSQSCNEDPLKILRNYYRGEGIVKETIIEGKG